MVAVATRDDFSALYVGQLAHRRWAPRAHKFNYPVFMVYLDLDEVEKICARSWLWSCRGPSLFWFKRSDYFGDSDISLKAAVYQKVEAELGVMPSGAVRMLTNLRTFGLRMNPITVYYVYSAENALEYVLAEVTNTPWDNRHVYVMDYRQVDMATTQRFAKELHVSPFMPMQQHYLWKTDLPSTRLRIQLDNIAVSTAAQTEECGEQRRTFAAVLALKREALSRSNMRSISWRFPWMTAKVAVSIYWQALKLWCKGAIFYGYQK